MRRREFMALLGACAAWGASAQPPRRRIGILMQGGPHYAGLKGLEEGLKAEGVAPQLQLIVRDGKGDVKTVETDAAAFEREGVELIMAFSTSVALAAQRATTSVPIVFAAGGDPVRFGLVDSIAKPGGRITGVHTIIADLTAKRLELLREIVPTLRRVTTFYNPDSRNAADAAEAALGAARLLGLELIAQEIRSHDDVREKVKTLGRGMADAFLFISDATVVGLQTTIVAAANVATMPTMAFELNLVADRALAGYGLNYTELGLLAARYVGRVLDGVQPRDLPVVAVHRPSLAINLKTAKALGITVPPSVLARADEVIE